MPYSPFRVVRRVPAPFIALCATAVLGACAPAVPRPATPRDARPAATPGANLAGTPDVRPVAASDVPSAGAPDLSARVEVIRTDHGVPHIFAQDLEAMGYALGWVQAEDYGADMIRMLVRNRGEMGRAFGQDSIDSDFYSRLRHDRAVETFPMLDADVRAVYTGFAEGVNRYITLHADALPAWARPVFTGPDVLAGEVSLPNPFARRRLVERLRSAANAEGARQADATPETPLTRLSNSNSNSMSRNGFSTTPEPGSNAWALAPGRTTSGAAILLRNPHLSWSSGYYEAHVVVPGVVEWYGDFRIGGPFSVVGGFNRRLGFATTNNSGADTDEAYALAVDPARTDHVLFNGASMAVRRHEVTAEFRNGPGYDTDTRTYWTTPLGPVIWRGNGKVYVLKDGGAGEYRNGEQLLRMMQAQSLDAWKQAMRMRGRVSSNFTYADADGNIFYVWNAAVPELPRPSGGDTMAVDAATSADVWSRLIPWDSLPHVQNPPGGYLQNENDPPYFANLNAVLDPGAFAPNLPAPQLRLRSQLAVDLIGHADRLSLEDVVRRKYSTRMLLADRVKDDLVRAVAASKPSDEVARAIDLVARWDNTTSREARGAMLFKTWWDRYVATGDSARATPESAGFPATAASLFAEPWRFDAPASTPRGLADPDRAVSAFEWAVAEMKSRWGAWDVPWGAIHRARIGDLDVPVSGCNGIYGCFRVLWYDEAQDGKLLVRGGDGWVVAVEFTQPVPRAYSVLAYGESVEPDSPYFNDQLAMFADERMKPVFLTRQDVEAHAVGTYRPGAASRP